MKLANHWQNIPSYDTVSTYIFLLFVQQLIFFFSDRKDYQITKHIFPYINSKSKNTNLIKNHVVMLLFQIWIYFNIVRHVLKEFTCLNINWKTLFTIIFTLMHRSRIKIELFIFNSIIINELHLIFNMDLKIKNKYI